MQVCKYSVIYARSVWRFEFEVEEPVVDSQVESEVEPEIEVEFEPEMEPESKVEVSLGLNRKSNVGSDERLKVRSSLSLNQR